MEGEEEGKEKSKEPPGDKKSGGGGGGGLVEDRLGEQPPCDNCQIADRVRQVLSF